MPFDEEGIYHLEDIAFVNNSLFTEAARDFRKHGCYTKAPRGSKDYNDFWDQEEDRLRNGMSAPGKLVTVNGIQKIQEVHITGENYGFINYARILRTKETDIQSLRNTILNSDSPILKHARKVGEKDFDFPKFIDGQYHWFTAKEEAFNRGLHIIMTKARQKGFSYMEGWDSALTVNMSPGITVLIGAHDYAYITLGDQMMPMAKSYLDFLELNTDFSRGYLKEDATKWIRMGYKLPHTGNIEYGYKSNLVAVSFRDNAAAAIGKKAKKIKVEEIGKLPNLKAMLHLTLPTLKDGSIMTGQMIMFGVPGDQEQDWTDAESIFYNPSSYDCLICENIWDENAKVTGSGCGFFYPQYIGDPLYVDDNGNSEVDKALAANDLERAKERKNKSGSEYTKYLSQVARCPKEAFISGSDNIFPAAEITDQLQRIENENDFKYLARSGRIVRTADGLKFKHNIELAQDGIPIHDAIVNHPLKDKQDVTGCYVEWISPYRDPSTGKIPKGLYRLWHDPYAHDKDAKDIKIKESLGVTYIYERTNNFTPGRGDYFIGCYVGRPPRVDDYNEHLLNIVEYVNGELMFENDRGDVKGYFARARKSHFLADEPDLEWAVQLQGKSGRHKGMHMNEARKGMGTIFLRDWLLEKRGTDIHGNERLNLHYIYDPALLRELLKWNPKGNFDRVSALLVGMYDMKECYNRRIEQPKKDGKSSIFTRKLFVN